jgi:hypothetical protein
VRLLDHEPRIGRRWRGLVDAIGRGRRDGLRRLRRFSVAVPEQVYCHAGGDESSDCEQRATGLAHDSVTVGRSLDGDR